MKPPVDVAVPPGVVTTTSTVPAACAPVTAVIDVAEATITDVAATPPIETVAPAMKPEPVTVTGVPPSVGPELGETAVIAGVGRT